MTLSRDVRQPSRARGPPIMRQSSCGHLEGGPGQYRPCFPSSYPKFVDSLAGPNLRRCLLCLPMTHRRLHAGFCRNLSSRQDDALPRNWSTQQHPRAIAKPRISMKTRPLPAGSCRSRWRHHPQAPSPMTSTAKRHPAEHFRNPLSRAIQALGRGSSPLSLWKPPGDPGKAPTPSPPYVHPTRPTS